MLAPMVPRSACPTRQTLDSDSQSEHGWTQTGTTLEGRPRADHAPRGTNAPELLPTASSGCRQAS
jgi:hypothetical protein